LHAFGEINLTRPKVPRLCGAKSEFAMPVIQSSERCISKIDIFSFVLILFEIILIYQSFDRQVYQKHLESCRRALMSTSECVEIPEFIPEFISVLIKSELSVNL
jgi:hypothetical protein